MAQESIDRPTSASPFAVKSGVPSSALIEKVLRSLPDVPDAVLGEDTVELFCERVRESARLLSEFPLTDNPIDRAESFRYLLTMLAYAVDAGLLNADPLEPMFSQPYRLHLLDWGGASPDSVYRRVMLRDDQTYRVSRAAGERQVPLHGPAPEQARVHDHARPARARRRPWFRVPARRPDPSAAVVAAPTRDQRPRRARVLRRLARRERSRLAHRLPRRRGRRPDPNTGPAASRRSST